MPEHLPVELKSMLELQGEASEPLFNSFVNEALRKSVSESIVVQVCTNASYAGSIYKHVSASGGESYVRQVILRIVNAHVPPSHKKTIRLLRRGVDTDKFWREVEEALRINKCPVFVRNKRLVQPLWRWNKSDGELVLSAELEEYSQIQLTDMIAHHAVQFQIWDHRLRDWRNMDPPPEIVRALHDAHHYMLPDITGIITSPTIRKNGTLIIEPGFDEETQLWYKSSDNVKLNVPEYPNRKDAEKALKKLNDLLVNFPFAEKSSRSAALAGMMTVAARGAIAGAVPLFMITAPDPRTGKTYLVHLSSYIGTGNIPVSTAAAERKEEFEKRVETAAMAGRAILHMNNLPNGMIVESDRLAELATEGKVTIRKLGRHEEGICDCRGTTAFLNGNNISVSEDLVPRTVSCTLDANMENPESRIFGFDPILEVRKNRGGFLSAIFTIIRAHRLAENIEIVWKRVAGFEQWSTIVQQPLIWLGLEDPMKGMEDMRGMDPRQEWLVRLLITLYKTFENNPFTVADCADRARNGNQDMKELMTDGKDINTRSFGRELKRSRNKKRGSLKLVIYKDDPNHGHQWQIEGNMKI